MGNGDGHFRDAGRYRAGHTYPAVTAVGDYNGDNWPDLAVANDFAIGVLLGLGHGAFGESTNFAAGSRPVFAVASDFNRDGKMDLAGAQILGADGVAVLLGLGNGEFRSAQIYGSGRARGPIAVADFNGDSAWDLIAPASTLITSNRVSEGVAVFLNDGAGAFQAPVVTYDLQRVASLAVADFNSDGQPDVALANSSSVSVLLGRGGGAFLNPVDYRAGSNPTLIKAADFDNDGTIDLAVANQRSASISILRGSRDGSFQAPLEYAVTANPVSLLVGDWDGNGAIDILTAGTPTLSVVLNALSVASPKLALERRGSGGAISYPAHLANWILESATTLNPTAWKPAMEQGVTNGNRLDVTLPFNPPERFFRLRRQ